MNFQKLKEFLDKKIEQSTDESTIDVFPIPCGLGKSQYIKYKISDCLNENTGLIVVTDSVERLSDYIIDDNDFSNYVRRNEKKIALLTNDTISNELKTLNYKPVILMTTQRFFQTTRAEIMKLTTYKYGKREKIIFDEKPYIVELLRIDIATVEKIDIELNKQLDNTIDAEDKKWLVEQWQNFIIKFKKLISQYENMNTGYQLSLWQDKKELPSITDDDNRFLTLVDKYRQYLNSNDNATVKNIKAIFQIADNGARFISFKKNKQTNSGETLNTYDNFFQVLIENNDKLLNVGAKVYILDGTADLTPEYDSYFVNKIDCSQFQRTYPNLTIRFIDLPQTSKTRLTSKENKKTVKNIADYINLLPYDVQAVFTHKSIRNELSKYYQNINHFGNIKGLNTYNQMNNLLQIGVFRFPDSYYFDLAGFKTLTANPKLRICVYQQTQYQKLQHNIMCRCIAADIEQNLFRSKIRNVDCKEPVTYTILFNVKEYAEVIDIMKSRFPKAKIEVVPTPTLFLKAKNQQRKNSKQSISQIIIDWLEKQPKGKIFKINDMYIELSISRKQFSKAKENNKSLSKIFQNMQTDKRGYYCIK